MASKAAIPIIEGAELLAKGTAAAGLLGSLSKFLYNPNLDKEILGYDTNQHKQHSTDSYPHLPTQIDDGLKVKTIQIPNIQPHPLAQVNDEEDRPIPDLRPMFSRDGYQILANDRLVGIYRRQNPDSNPISQADYLQQIGRNQLRGNPPEDPQPEDDDQPANQPNAFNRSIAVIGNQDIYNVMKNVQATKQAYDSFKKQPSTTSQKDFITEYEQLHKQTLNDFPNTKFYIYYSTRDKKFHRVIVQEES